MANKKYEFTGETKEWRGKTLHRIRAVADFGNVKKGDVGGWLEREGNLSVDGCCWVFDEAYVTGEARVFDRAQVSDRARVYGQAYVGGQALVGDYAQVYGHALVYGRARVGGQAQVCKPSDVVVIGPIGSRIDSYTTFYRCSDEKIRVTCGCFYGTIGEFLEKVEATHGDNKHAQVYRLAAALAEKQIELEEEAKQ